MQASTADLRFTIQFGAFTEKDNAERLKQALDLTSSGSFIGRKNIDGTTFYRVRYGSFQSKNEAMQRAEAFAEEGYTVIVVNR